MTLPQTRFKNVAVGGTFDILHKGHEMLLAQAFATGENVLIGVVSDRLAGKLPKRHQILPFEQRVKRLERYIDEHGWSSRTVIRRLDDKYGRTVSDPSIQAIIVTPDTMDTTIEINRIRRERGFKPLEVVIVDLVMAYDGSPISTTRIRRGEIDSQGDQAVRE